jgi:toxin secretion/phage lysis holin
MCLIIGTFASTVSTLLGGWDGLMQFVVQAMVVDFATGLAVAIVFKKSEKTTTGAYRSGKCAEGFCKKVAYLCLIMLANKFDSVMGINLTRDVVAYGVIANEVGSFIENLGLMGVKIPKGFTNMFDVLKQKGDNTNE